MPKATLDARLLAAQVAIDNALNDAEIQSYLSQYGYDFARIVEGKSLFQSAQQLQQRQKAEYGRAVCRHQGPRRGVGARRR